MAEEGEYYLLSATRQIELLRSQGLGFQDENSALQVLNRIGLFRMEGYLYPLRITGGDFKGNATFEQALNLYNFDSTLRRTICSALEEIEVSIRTQLSHIVTDLSDDPFWFLNPSNFRLEDFVYILTEKLQNELNRTDDELIVNYLREHNCSMAPSWVIMEVSSFGTLSKMYKNLRYSHYRRVIADYYGISKTVLESWLYTLVNIRNVCAHYGRLWNRNIRIPSSIPRHTSRPFLSTIPRTDRIYYVMSMILYFLQNINPQNTFVRRIKELLREYSHIDVRAMGFPNGWETEPLWQS